MRTSILAGYLVLISIVLTNSPARAGDPSSTSFFGKLFRSSKTDRLDTRPTLPPVEAAQACIAAAHEMAEGGHNQEAISLFEKARQLDPKQKRVARYLAVLYDREGATGQALTEYNRALELTPKDPDLLNDLGYFYYQRGDYAQSERCLHAALKESPKHERALVNLGLVMGNQEKYQDSFEAFAKALGPAAAHSNVGMILAQHGHQAKAKQALQQALTLQPELPQPRAVLAYLDNPRRASDATAAIPAASPRR